MNGLQTARVIIVDDDFTEVEPLLRGLSTLGIGCAYFSGDERELPYSPLAGIRLVFLDLHLIAGAGTGHGMLSNTVGVLTRLIPEKKGEVGIVCWTKHSEDQRELESLLKERVPALEPAFLLCLSKRDFLPVARDAFAALIEKLDAMFDNAAGTGQEADGAAMKGISSSLRDAMIGAIREASDTTAAGEGAKVDALRDQIEKMLNELRGSRLIWEWEQAVHNAAGDTSSLLHGISDARKEGESRENALMAVFASLARAAGGDSITTPAAAAASLFEGMNPLHADFLDQVASNIAGSAPHYTFLLDALQANHSLNPLQKAQTNAAILTAKIPESVVQFQPGNLYIADPAAADGCPHELCKIEKAELAYGLIEPKPDGDCKALILKIQSWKKLKLTSEEVEKFKEELRTRLEALRQESLVKCLAAVLEVTPACDFANKRFTPARFVGCLVVPNDCEDKILEPEFVRRLKPLTLHCKDGNWHLLLNSRFMFGLSNPRVRIKTPPLVRIRLPLLIDIQAWLAAQGARPGYIAV
jgi:hypothetical protein